MIIGYQFKKDPKVFHNVAQKQFRLKKPERQREIDKKAYLKRKAKDLLDLGDEEAEKKAVAWLRLWKEGNLKEYT